MYVLQQIKFIIYFKQEVRNTTDFGLCCSPKQLNGCDICHIDLQGFRCTIENFCFDYYCTNLRTGTTYIINHEMEKKYEDQLLTSTTSPDSLISTTDDWDAWSYIKVYAFIVLLGIIVFFSCFFYLRHTGVYRTIRRALTSDPEDVYKQHYDDFDR